MNQQRTRTDAKSWRTHTRLYSFSIFESESGRTELLTYHYHPDSGVEWPHLHVKGRTDWLPTGLRKSHIATGRMTIEGFVIFLIDELGVKEQRSGWREDLAKNLKVFGERRTW